MTAALAHASAFITGWGVVANLVAGTKPFRQGARVWVLQVKGESAMVAGPSRGGREIQMWIRTKILSNFRPRWTPDAAKRWASDDSTKHAAMCMPATKNWTRWAQAMRSENAPRPSSL